MRQSRTAGIRDIGKKRHHSEMSNELQDKGYQTEYAQKTRRRKLNESMTQPKQEIELAGKPTFKSGVSPRAKTAVKLNGYVTESPSGQLLKQKQARTKKTTPIIMEESGEDDAKSQRRGNRKKKEKRQSSIDSYDKISVTNPLSKQASPHKYSTRNNKEVKEINKFNLQYKDELDKMSKEIQELFFFTSKKDKSLYLNTLTFGEIFNVNVDSKNNTLEFTFASLILKDKNHKKIEIEAGQCLDFKSTKIIPEKITFITKISAIYHQSNCKSDIYLDYLPCMAKGKAGQTTPVHAAYSNLKHQIENFEVYDKSRSILFAVNHPKYSGDRIDFKAMCVHWKKIHKGILVHNASLAQQMCQTANEE